LSNDIEHLFEIQHRLEEIIGVPKIDLIQKGAMLDPFFFTVTTEKLGQKRDCMAGVQKAGWKSICWWIATVCNL